MTDVAEELVQASANTNTLQEYIDLIKTDQLEDPNTLEQDVADQTESLISIEEVDSFSVWQVVSSAAINLVLPFINGLMLGFGEIVAHEIGFKYGWYSAKVSSVTGLVC